MGTAWRDYMREGDRPSFGRAGHPTTWWLLGILVGLWFLYAGARGWAGSEGTFYRFIDRHLTLHPDDVLQRGHVWQVFTAIFLHDPGNPWHLLWNSLGLVFFGRHVESMLGSRGLWVLFLRAGLACTLSILPLWLVLGGSWSALGSSGSVYGIAAFLALRHPHLEVYFFLIRMPLWVLVGVLMVGLEVVNLVVLANPAASTVGHLAGAAYGFVHHRWLSTDVRGRGPGLFGRWRQRLRTAREQREADRSEDERSRVEALLDKITRDGIGSLSGAEKDFLQRASKRYPRT